MGEEILVLFGKHDGSIASLKETDEKNMAELIGLKHTPIQIQPNDFVRNCEPATIQYSQQFLNKPATVKHLYYVGHGNANGLLELDDGMFDLGNIFPGTKPHKQKLHLHLFMCYQHEAFESVRKRLNGDNHLDRQLFSEVKLAKARPLTQRLGDRINELIISRQLNKSVEKVLDELTRGDEKKGHYNLYYELENERRIQDEEKGRCQIV